MATEKNSAKDPRVYFAAERTYLAWLRTAMALMAVGFVVGRVAQVGPYSSWVAIALLSVSVGVIALSAGQYRQTLRRLDRGLLPQPPLALLVFFTAVLILAGLALIGLTRF